MTLAYRRLPAVLYRHDLASFLLSHRHIQFGVNEIMEYSFCDDCDNEHDHGISDFYKKSVSTSSLRIMKFLFHFDFPPNQRSNCEIILLKLIYTIFQFSLSWKLIIFLSKTWTMIMILIKHVVDRSILEMNKRWFFPILFVKSFKTYFHHFFDCFWPWI
jgi:hypothetical protein